MRTDSGVAENFSWRWLETKFMVSQTRELWGSNFLTPKLILKQCDAYNVKRQTSKKNDSTSPPQKKTQYTFDHINLPLCTLIIVHRV